MISCALSGRLAGFLLLAVVSALCQRSDGFESEKAGPRLFADSWFGHPQNESTFFSSGKWQPSFNARESAQKSGWRGKIVAKTAPWLISCSRGDHSDFAANCESRPALGITVWRSDSPPTSSNTAISRETKAAGFQWGPALWQSLEFLVLEHAFRLANDREARYLLVHRPFWHDYFASASHFNMDHWGDGDDFLVNYIGHPLQGSIAGDIFIQNDPEGRAATLGKSSAYWKSRIKAMAWAAVYSTYFEIGPILSEAAIGNEGGYTYIPGCGFYPTCTKKPGRTYKPPTNNTGWVDFVVTPTIGLGWIVLEDAVETKIVDRIAQGRHTLKFNILRGTLTPSRSMSNLLAGKLPWYRASDETPASGKFGKSLAEVKGRPPWKNQPRWDLGLHVISLHLPTGPKGCSGCGTLNPGAGLDLSYRLTRFVYLSSEFNVFPGGKRAAQEGLFGVKVGHSSHSWGLYSQARPGFLRYDASAGPGATGQYDSTTRFVFDLGGAFDYYTSPRSAIRLNLGTNLVRYSTHPDINQPPVSVLSNDYVATQGNFYFSGGYVFRF